MFPFASGQCDACISFVPREETNESDVAVGLHGTGQHVELRAARTNQGAGAAQVDEEPIPEEMLSVIRQQRALTDKLHAALNLELRLTRGVAETVEFSGDGCGGQRDVNIWEKLRI